MNHFFSFSYELVLVYLTMFYSHSTLYNVIYSSYSAIQLYQLQVCQLKFCLSVVVAIAPGQFLRAGRGQKPQICRSNCHRICYSFGDKYFRFWWSHCHFRLSVVAAIARGQFLRAGRGRKLQFCRWNCHPKLVVNVSEL